MLANGIGGIASAEIRRSVQTTLQQAGWRFATVQHPSAIVSSRDLPRPSMKSVKEVCAKVKEQTLSIFKPVKNEEVVQRVNKILVGWGNYFQCGYPRKAFDKVNWYVRNRLYLHFNRKSQRGYVLKYAPNFYSELQAMGLHRLQRRRK